MYISLFCFDLTQWWGTTETINPFPAFRTSYEVCEKVHFVQFVCCYTVFNANFLPKFKFLVHSEAGLSSKDEHF